MRDAGTFDFHSHTHTHTRWDRQIADQAERDQALAEDLAASRAALAARLGADSPHLCWPQGYYDAAYQRVAQATGFTHLYTTEHGVVRRDTDPARIPRLVIKDKPAPWFGRRMGLRPAAAVGALSRPGIGQEGATDAPAPARTAVPLPLAAPEAGARPAAAPAGRTRHAGHPPHSGHFLHGARRYAAVHTGLRRYARPIRRRTSRCSCILAAATVHRPGRGR